LLLLLLLLMLLLDVRPLITRFALLLLLLQAKNKR